MDLGGCGTSSHCYCGIGTTDSDMLQCQECKKLFHPGCLRKGRPSHLLGDVFFTFTCESCSEDNEEHCERMRIQWIQVILLTLYNMQVQGGGKRGYFRWREHICKFIDKNWTTFFGNTKKKTSTWHGTVAGTLSAGCPQHFRSGISELGESGWWTLTNSKPPSLQEFLASITVNRTRRSKSSTTKSLGYVLEEHFQEGRRPRNTRNSIEAAIKLKEKRYTLQEAKDMRKAMKNAYQDDSHQKDTSSATFASFDACSSFSDNKSPLTISFNSSGFQSHQMLGFKTLSTAQELMATPMEVSECPPAILLKEETVESVDVEFNYHVQTKPDVRCSTALELPNDSTMEDLLDQSLCVSNDDDSLLDIDILTDFTRNDVLLSTSKNSMAVEELISTLPVEDGVTSEIPETLEEKNIDAFKSEEVEDVLSDVSNLSIPSLGKLEIVKSEEENTVDYTDSKIKKNTESFIQQKKQKSTQNEDEKKSDETDIPIVVPMSTYEEQQLLRKVEKVSSVLNNNPKAKRLRRKLIVRQKKDDVPSHLLGPQSELHVLDRYQRKNYTVHGRSEHHTSFITRLMGLEDTHLDSIISPYTSRILKPFIFRDYESTPLKLQLMEEIKAFPHRNDLSWKPPAGHPLDYCYVRPQHIPVINSLCHEFFWPGIDLSECLQYPDFSCVVLYRKVIIGFAFMVPDVSYNEAYISFIFTHPEWRRAGIAKFMLYHLIQTCMGKDVTLHVSATNPAVILYQKFGFKVEEFILDFYDKYLPFNSKECRHAMFMRLNW
ncbi:ada2a-containing complex component 2 isoform X2 [Tachypleus tridentatus]|uniref:ada2a-containing complex component 2 isoform X2 n=1 Tax=Tachypleus tridentatus TaxID=6853 RepID=UPI003FD66287